MAEINKVDESQQMTVNSRGGWEYPSAAASGHVEIVLPAPHGPNSEQRMHIRDFPAIVLREVEQSFRPNMYEKSAPRKSPTETFRHYIGAAKGAQLMDDAGIRRLESLAKEFEEEPDREEYFAQVIKPYFLAMTPKRR
jgi:hypothetical protein